MRSRFVVFSVKNLLDNMLIIFMLLIACIVSLNIANNLVETASGNRLLPIYSVETTENKVALTFDCAWGADDISDIVNTLNANNVKATFFAVGDWIQKHPGAVKILNDAGMEIGNHSDSHAHVNMLSHEANLKDMTKCNDKIAAITGKNVKFYRGPYGEYNNTVINVAEELGMKVIQWDVDTLDYEGKTAGEMCERIKKKIRNGSIILMHNDTKHTADGLQQIIDTITNLGYQIVPLDELIYWENYEINHEGRQILTK
ncbi:MAG: polysaccharide deacetylase family protein [Clostridia bacterium]|nr:polysaccharide deacetylase family protein [Clostridia bacterium]